MRVSQHRSYRALAGLACVLGLVSVPPATWALLTLIAFSAAMMVALLATPSLRPARTHLRRMAPMTGRSS